LENLAKYSESDLKAIGLSTVGSRRKFATAIASLLSKKTKAGAQVTKAPEGENGVNGGMHRVESWKPIDVSASINIDTEEMAAFYSEADAADIRSYFRTAWQEMPNCAEKSLVLLSSHFLYLEKVPRQQGKEATPLLSAEEVAAIYELLPKQWASEQHSIKLPSLDTSTDPQTFAQLLAEIRPLDMQLLMHMVTKVAVASSQIKGKDVILLLGYTGSGKSTLIHYLGGSELRPVLHGHIEHLEPVVKEGSPLAAVSTNHLPRSETDAIHAVEVNIKGVRGAVTLCDTPGFDDTSGPEKDIANGLVIVRAVRGCKSVKPLIVISSDRIGGRWEGVTQLAHTLVKFVGDMEKTKEAFQYIFTKFNDLKAKGIPQSLQTKTEHLTLMEQSDSAFVTLLKDMAEKTTSGAITLNLPSASAPAPDELLKQLTSGPQIPSTATVFRDYVTAESLSKLKVQMDHHRRAVATAVSQVNIPLLRYKLNQLRALESELDIPDTRLSYAECKSEVDRAVADLISETHGHLTTSLQDGNTTIEEPLALAAHSICRLLQLAAVRQEHTSAGEPVPDADQVILDYVLECQIRLCGAISDDVNEGLHTALLGEWMSKMVCISKMFGSVLDSDTRLAALADRLHAQYLIARSAVSKELAATINLVNAAITSGDFLSVISAMDNVAHFIKYCKAHLDASILEEADALNLHIVAAVTPEVEQVSAFFENTDMDGGSESIEAWDKQVHAFHKVLLQLNNLVCMPGMDRHVPIKIFQDLYDGVLASCKTCLEASHNVIRAMDRKEIAEVFKAVQQRMVLFMTFRQQPKIAVETMDLFNSLLHCMKEHVMACRETALAILRRAPCSSTSSTTTEQQNEEYQACMWFLHAATVLPQEIMGPQPHFAEVQAEAVKVAEAHARAKAKAEAEAKDAAAKKVAAKRRSSKSKDKTPPGSKNSSFSSTPEDSVPEPPPMFFPTMYQLPSLSQFGSYNAYSSIPSLGNYSSPTYLQAPAYGSYAITSSSPYSFTPALPTFSAPTYSHGMMPGMPLHMPQFPYSTPRAYPHQYNLDWGATVTPTFGRPAGYAQYSMGYGPPPMYAGYGAPTVHMGYGTPTAYPTYNPYGGHPSFGSYGTVPSLDPYATAPSLTAIPVATYTSANFPTASNYSNVPNLAPANAHTYTSDRGGPAKQYPGLYTY